MPLSLKIFSRATGQTRFVAQRAFDEERVTIGRNPTCTLALDDPGKYLSRVHAELLKLGQGYLLRVLSATAPVLVNGESRFHGSEVMVRPGDTFSMDVYDLEIVGAGDAKAATAAAQPASQPSPRLDGPPVARVQGPSQGAGRSKWPFLGGIAVAGIAALAFAWPMVKGLLPGSEEQRKAELNIARLDGEARSLLKLVDSDRRELKEAAAASGREIERVEGLVRAARTSEERTTLDASLAEARRMAKVSTSLEAKVREQVEGPVTKAEGSLSAAAAAAKGGDKTEAARLIEETVATLTQMRAKIAEDRKTTQAELEKRREDLLAAETRAMAEVEAKAKAIADAEAKAKAKAEAEARAKAAPAPQAAPPAPPPAPAPAQSAQVPGAAQPAQAAKAAQEAQAAKEIQAAGATQVAASPCLGKLAGSWSHTVGGTWTFSGNQGTQVVESGNYGARAQQITVMSVSSCENDTMTYKVVRLALVNTDDPAQAYDKTPANTPALSSWAKVNTQRYAISGAGLRFGNYTYAKR